MAKYYLQIPSHTDSPDYEDEVEASSLGEAAHKLAQKMSQEAKDNFNGIDLENYISF